MNKWVKELRVRERKIKQQAIRHVGDVEIIVIIEEKGSVRNADLEELLKYDNQVGELGIELLIKRRAFMLRIDYYLMITLFFKSN